MIGNGWFDCALHAQCLIQDVDETKCASGPVRRARLSIDRVNSDERILCHRKCGAGVREILKGEPDGSALKVSVNGGGCSGFYYAFDVGKEIRRTTSSSRGMAPAWSSIPYRSSICGARKIDFVDDLMGQSFRINNPMATSGCGCGTSFSI